MLFLLYVFLVLKKRCVYCAFRCVCVCECFQL